MSETLNNPKPDPIEPWLEAYAQKRRQELDEPIELDEATRTLLQGEVSRVYPQEACATESGHESRWPARWSWALAGAAGAVAVVVSLNISLPRSSGSMDMAAATVEERAPERPANQSTGEASDQEQAGASIAQPAAVRGNHLRSATSPNAGAAAPATPVAPRPAMASTMRNAPGGNHPAKVRQLDPTFYSNLAALRQNFQQLPTDSAADFAEANSSKTKRTLPAAVLANFQIERQGQVVKILDQDGSVYTGQVINEESYAAPQPKALNATAGASAAPTIAAPASPARLPAQAGPEKALATDMVPGQFYFRARGTNNTLRKVVVIEATLDHDLKGQAWPYKRDQARKAMMNQAGVQALVPAQPAQLPEAEEAKETLTKQEAMQRAQHQRRVVTGLRILGNARIGKENFPLNAYQESAKAVEENRSARLDGNRK